jgi:flagellar basal-body rod modification protein FlgD
VHASLMQMLHSATQPPVSSSAASTSAATNTSSSSASSSSDPGVDLTNTFLQLLSVQLENQSPLNPVDPNQFVTQLATFDSLGELTQIQSLMQTLVNDVGGSSPTGVTTGVTPGAAANATSIPNSNSISH